MHNYYWNDWYAGWGWMLWFGMIFLVFSTTGNWGYTYQAHRRYFDFPPGKDALDLLSERYAKGEINREEFHRVKEEIQAVMNVRGDSKLSKDHSKSGALGAPIRGT